MCLPRPLTATERAVAWDLLEKACAPELRLLAAQLDAATVVDECECGCPTVSIAVDSSSAERVSYTARPVATADFDGGSIMVWIDEGWMSHLEIYWWSDETPTEFPDLAQLTGHRLG